MKLPLEPETTLGNPTSVSGETATDQVETPAWIGWSESDEDDPPLPLPPSPEIRARMKKERAAQWAKGRPARLAKERAAKLELERTDQEIKKLKEAGAVDALIEMLRAQPHHLKILVTLGDMNAPRALPTMIRAAASQSDGWGPFDLHGVRCTAIAGFGEVTTPHLLDLLQVGNERERRLSVELLAEVSDPNAAGPLLGLLEHADDAVAAWAAKALGLLGAESVLPALSRCINDVALSYDRRCAAATAVRLIEHDRLRRDLKRRVKAALSFDEAVQGVDRSQHERISREILDALGALAERYQTNDVLLWNGAWGLMYLLHKSPEEKWELWTDYEDSLQGGYPTKQEGAGGLPYVYEEDRVTRLLLGMLRVCHRDDMEGDCEWMGHPSSRKETLLVPHTRWEAQCAEFPSLA